MCFLRYFYFRPFFYLISYCKAENLPTPEGKELQRLKRQFWKWHDQGNNLGGCRSCYCANPGLKYRRPSSVEAPPIGKIHPFGKLPISRFPNSNQSNQILCHSRFVICRLYILTRDVKINRQCSRDG